MSEGCDVDETVRALKSALASKALDGNVADLARQCLGRLTGTVRLSVLGPAVAEGSEVLNFVVGQRVATPQSGACLLQLQQDGSPSAKAYYADGKNRAFVGDVVSQAYADAPAMVQFGFDLPALKKLSVVRAMSPGGADLRRTTRWAAMESDVALWCSTTFSEEEEKIWCALPERLQHHGYLVLPRGLETADQIRQRASDLFADIIEFDGRAASKARSAPGGVDKEKFRAAGGPTLVRAMKREIEQIKKAALDAAQVILLRHVETTRSDRAGAAARTPSRPASNPLHLQAASSAPQAVQTQTTPMRPRLVVSQAAPTVTRPVGERPAATPWSMNLQEETETDRPSRPRSRPLSRSRTRSVSMSLSEEAKAAAIKAAAKAAGAPVPVDSAPVRQTAALTPVETKAPTASAPTPAEVVAIFNKVTESFEARAQTVLEMALSGEDLNFSLLVQDMADDVEKAVTLLSDPAIASRPEVVRLRECVEETGELLILMALEDDAKSAEDGVCLLLQIRREAQGCLAA